MRTLDLGAARVPSGKTAYKECIARRGYKVSPAGQPLAPPVQGPPVHQAAARPRVQHLDGPLNVWKSAPIGPEGAMVRYQLIEKGSSLDTCTPPLVSVRIYEGGVECAPAGLLK